VIDMTDISQHIIREGYGEGYDEREALQNWLSSDEFEFMGIGRGNAALDTANPVTAERIRKPKKARRAHVDRYKQSGSRQWKTMYRVEDKAEHEFSCWETQADAIEEAKMLSLKSRQTFCIVCFKQLEDGNRTVACVTPGNSKPGRWRFSAIFRY